MIEKLAAALGVEPAALLQRSSKTLEERRSRR